jgi:septal ring factor EnvC (AmiA/AmiB activator)
MLVVLIAGWGGAQETQQRILQRYGREIRMRGATLDSIRAELTRGREKIVELRRREESSLEVLEQLDRNVTMAEQYLAALTGSIDSVSAQIEVLEEALAGEEKQLRLREKMMMRRLVSMYRAAWSTPLDVFLAADEPTELIRRAFYFRRLKEYDEHLIRQIEGTRRRISSNKVALEEERAQQTMLLEEKRREQEQLVAERESRQAVLAEIQSEKDAYLTRVEELEAAQKQLASLIRSLQTRKAAAARELERSLSAKFAKRKGRLPWPVRGTLVATFGRVVHPVYKTVTMNNGIDVGLAVGEPVRCVAVGIVAYVGRMRGLGRFIVVDHFGGYLTIYANLASIAVAQGDEVEYGTILGAAGAAAGGGGGRLHFEVRKSTEALDPLEWLEEQG